MSDMLSELLMKLQDGHPDFTDDLRFKRLYVNHLDWTEPIALMLADLEDEPQVIRMVRLALEVDLLLGARLAGFVKSQFQQQAVRLVNDLPAPYWLKIELLKATRSEAAIPELINAIEHESNLEMAALLKNFTKDDLFYGSPTIVKATERLCNDGTFSALVDGIRDGDPAIRLCAASALERMSNDADVFGLLRNLSSEDMWVRQYMSATLKHMSIENAIDILIEVFNNREENTYISAGITLAKIGTNETIFVLVSAFKEQNVSHSLVNLLSRLPKNIAIQILVENLNHENLILRRQITVLLGTIGVKTAIPHLIEELSDRDYEVRAHAAIYLGKVAATEAIDKLINALSDEDSSVRLYSAVAFGNMGATIAIPNLINNLTHSYKNVIKYTAEALGKL